MRRDDLVHYLDERLGIRDIDDVSVNGLQVEGAAEIRKIALITDAAMALFSKASAAGCDMIIAHHGIIWGGIKAVRGPIYNQIKLLLDNNINLYAAHLPLDAHPELGNNAQLGAIAGLTDTTPFGLYHGAAIGIAGRLPSPLTPEELSDVFVRAIGGTPMLLPFGKARLETVAIVSGGGSSALPEAIAAGIDCFVTGEGRHENHHLALEAGIHVMLLGHYHSETVGVKAVGREIEERFGIETIFIDEPTIL
jgi:dinuclear metal center YbgI/SA1388 family protein